MSRPNNKKTILLIRNVAPRNFGGAEKYQLKLASKLTEHGYTPIILSSSRQMIVEAKQKSLRAYKAPFCRQQNWSSWRNLLIGFFFLWELYLFFWYSYKIIKLRPSTIQVQSRDDLIAVTISGKIFGVRIIWVDHADFRNWVMQNVNVRFKNIIGKTILRLARHPYKIVFVCDRDKKYFEKISKRHLSNLVTIYNGADDQKKKYRGVKPTPGRCCYIGRVVREKGAFELLEAFRPIADADKNVTLHFCGDSEIQDPKKNQVFFHGYLEDPLPELAKSEIFVLPSYGEGLSLSLVEACMLGKAIITTSVGGSGEVIQNGENGLLIPPKDPAALESALRTLLYDKNMASRFSKQARLTYETKFNFDKIFLNDIIKLYK